jgi:hypothetical protein
MVLNPCLYNFDTYLLMTCHLCLCITMVYYSLVGGFKHWLFSIIYGIILPIDFHMFQDGYCTTNQIIINHHQQYNKHTLTIYIYYSIYIY